MGFKDSFKNLFIIDEEDFEEEEEYIEETKSKRESGVSRSRTMVEEPKEYKQKGTQKDKRPTSFSLTNPNAFKMLLVEPKSANECQKLIDSLKGRRPIVVNLENIETDTARKIFDTLNGAVYALNGTVQRVSNNIFIFAPENVDISDNSSKSSGGFDFGSDKSPWR